MTLISIYTKQTFNLRNFSGKKKKKKEECTLKTVKKHLETVKYMVTNKPGDIVDIFN